MIGIEPNADMRRQAERHESLAGISYRDGLSTQTGLPDSSADIVTCSQSFHWMEPEPTLAEIARILRPGGVFAAVDCDWPPSLNWEVEAAYAFLRRRWPNWRSSMAVRIACGGGPSRNTWVE